MNLSVLFPPTLVRRVVEDLAAVADAARRLPQLQLEVVERLNGIQAELGALRTTVAPIGELPAVRRAAEPLSDQLERLGETVAPIRELSAIRRDADPLPDQLAALRSGLEALDGRLQALDELRAGIEPLDEDMRAVRNSVDDLEPLLRGLRSDLAPLGELAEKIPGIG
jgi:chromosome segregation ATPase